MKKLLKIVLGVTGALVLVALAGLLAASEKTSAKLNRRYASHELDLPVPNPLSTDEHTLLREERLTMGGAPLTEADVARIAEQQAIARGQHLVEARYGCNVCHGKDLGGGVMVDDAAIGSLHGPNLTRGKGGRVASYTVADWDRIVRHGLKPDGTPAVMPSEDFFAMTDHELSDVIAYLRALPPIDRAEPAPSFGPVGKMLVALGKFPISAEKVGDHKRAHAAAPPATGDTPEFGAHLAAGCTTCHRPNMAGGPMQFGPPDWPAAANLTPHESGLGRWSFEDFDKALTQGTSKDGRKIREPMSHLVPSARAMTETERRAIWTYLRTLPALPTNG